MNKCVMCDQFFHTLNDQGYCRQCWDKELALAEQVNEDNLEYEGEE